MSTTTTSERNPKVVQSLERVGQAAADRRTAEESFRRAVRAASADGASLREIAAPAGLSFQRIATIINE